MRQYQQCKCSIQLVLTASSTDMLALVHCTVQIEELVTEVISGVSTPPRQSTARTRQKELFAAANPVLAPYYTPAVYDGFTALLSSARAAAASAAAAAAAAVSSDSGNSGGSSSDISSGREAVTDSSATDVTADVSADVASVYEEEQAAPTTSVPAENTAETATVGDGDAATVVTDDSSAATDFASEDIEGKSTLSISLL
jgi:hypothetical protein